MLQTRRKPVPAVAAALLPGLALVAVTASATPAAAFATYQVQAGDTLSEIAAEHGVATSELASVNGITNLHLIRIGQDLQIPVPERTSYTVAAGDTFYSIGQAHGVPADDIAALNGLADPTRLSIGQVLEMPAAGNPGTGYPSLPSRITSNPERLELLSSFERWAAHYDVPPDLLMAIAYQESGWQSSVVSSAGAIGVGQLLPATADWVASDLVGLPELDPTVPDDNIRMSARFLAWLIGQMGSVDQAVAAYYQGPTSVRLLGWYSDTETYVANVDAHRAWFQRG